MPSAYFIFGWKRALEYLILSVILSACTPAPPPARVPTVVDFGPETSEHKQWSLLWSDEFEGARGEAIDASKWRFDIGGHGWGNQQLEFTTDRLENASLDGEGSLAIIARRERYQGKEYTAARINTRERFQFRYGRVEARIKLPRGQGIWPAFWMLGANFPGVSWPDCGEIDIMEFRGQRPFESTGAVHGQGFSAGQAIGAAYQSPIDLSEDFHLFALEWSAEEITWFVDEHRFMTLRPDELPKSSSWPFDQEFFLILNIAVGGHYVGSPDESTNFPQTMLIDYVRIYQHESDREGHRR